MKGPSKRIKFTSKIKRKMKNLLCSLVLLSAISLSAGAQSASAIIKKLKALPEAQVTEISNAQIMEQMEKQLAAMDEAERKEKEEEMKKMKHIKLLSMAIFGECPQEQRLELEEDIKKLRRRGYDQLMKTGADEGRIEMLVKEKWGKVREVFMPIVADEGCVLIYIDCKLDRDDVPNLVNVSVNRN